jgi:TonB family protein
MMFISVAGTLADGLQTGLAALRIRRVQLGGVGLVMLVHLIAIWILSEAMVSPIAPPRIGELHMVLVPEVPQARPEAPPPVDLPDVVMQPPEIVIQDESSTATISAISPADVLAPRPDPSHPNEPPRLSPMHSSPSRLTPVMLQVLVMENGSISMAKIMQSCGDSAVDNDIVAYVKANWRFLPALVKEKTVIQYWMTVAVRFEG